MSVKKQRQKINDHTWLSQHKFLDNCKETKHVSCPARPASTESKSGNIALHVPPQIQVQVSRNTIRASITLHWQQIRSKLAVISRTLEPALSRLSIIQLLPNFAQTSTQISCKLFNIDSWTRAHSNPPLVSPLQTFKSRHEFSRPAARGTRHGTHILVCTPNLLAPQTRIYTHCKQHTGNKRQDWIIEIFKAASSALTLALNTWAAFQINSNYRSSLGQAAFSRSRWLTSHALSCCGPRTTSALIMT